MRHATSWQKNQSGHDALGRPLETSTTTVIIYTVLLQPLLRLSTTTNTIHIKFETNLRERRAIGHIIIIVIRQKHHNRHRHVFFFFFFFFCFFFFLSSFISFFDMQQLSNDTGTWSLIVAPLPAPLFYNSNTSD